MWYNFSMKTTAVFLSVLFAAAAPQICAAAPDGPGLPQTQISPEEVETAETGEQPQGEHASLTPGDADAQPGTSQVQPQKGPKNSPPPPSKQHADPVGAPAQALESPAEDQEIVERIDLAAACKRTECRSLLAGAPFSGQKPNPAFWTNLTKKCKEKPHLLIIADMGYVPAHMRRAGFPGRDTALWYSLSRTYIGANWSPEEDQQMVVLSKMRDQIHDWWSRYVQEVQKVMLAAPMTTAVIVANDGKDRLGDSLGRATYRNLRLPSSRLSLGNTLPE